MITLIDYLRQTVLITHVLTQREYDAENWKRMADNPMASMIMVNGLIMDARRAPVAIQQAAVQKGLVPHLAEVPF